MQEQSTSLNIDPEIVPVISREIKTAINEILEGESECDNEENDHLFAFSNN
jgi:hypothetical protein